MTSSVGTSRRGPGRRRHLRDALWPVSPVAGAVAATVLTAVVLSAVPASLLQWYPATWFNFSYELREAAWLGIPVMALLGGYYGNQFRPNAVIFGPASGRGQGAIGERLAVGLAFVAGIAVLTGVLAAASAAAARGADGQLPPAEIVAVWCAFWAAGTVGACLGRVAPTGAWSLVAPLGALAVFLLPSFLDMALVDTGYTSTAIALTWGLRLPDAGWAVPASVALLRAGFFLAVGMVAASWLPQPSTSAHRLRQALAGLLVPTMIAVVVVASPRISLAELAVEDPACTRTGQMSLCLTKENGALLDDLEAPLSTMARLAPSARLVVVEQPLAAAETDVRLQPPWTAADEATYVQDAVYSVASALAHEDVCDDARSSAGADGQHTVVGAVVNRFVAAAGVPFRVAGISEDTGEPVVDDGLGELASMSDAEFADWYAEHEGALRSCALAAW